MNVHTTVRPGIDTPAKQGMQPGRISKRQAEELGNWAVGLTGAQLRDLTPSQAFVDGFTAGYEAAMDLLESMVQVRES